jgi:cyclase
MKRILRAGADKVSVNTSALERPELIKEGSDFFGAQCIVVAIDARFSEEDGTWMVYTHGGRNKTNWQVVEWAKEVVRLGAGEILLTSMNQDGEKTGFDLPLTKAVRDAVTVPVIASGGAGNAEHFVEVLKEVDADAALAASIFHYKETSVAEVKATLRERGVCVR